MRTSTTIYGRIILNATFIFNSAHWRSFASRLLGATFTAVMLWLGLLPSALAIDLPGATPEAGAGQPFELQDQELETLDLTRSFASDTDFTELERVAINQGAVRVIVTPRVAFTPEGLLPSGEAEAQRAKNAGARAQLIAALAGTRHVVVRKYTSVPSVALSLSAEAVRALRKSGLAARVEPDTLARPGLASSTPVIEANEAQDVQRNGSGRLVAVLDTGVDKDHPFIGSTQVMNEACFAQGENQGSGDCPNGSSSMIDLGAGEDCTYSEKDCWHGTHVAGIVMGGWHSSSPGGGVGVAPSASVIPIQVFHKVTIGDDCTPQSPCAWSWTSDQIAALDYLFNLPTARRDRIAAVNMSIWGDEVFDVACDERSIKSAIDNLRSVGIATVIISGNGRSNTGVSYPGCVSTAVTVGATDDTDHVAPFSNSSPLVDLLAPGVNITSAIPNADPPPTGENPPYAEESGTSMAAPMVAGAFAILDQVKPSASVASHLRQLGLSGVLVTDPDNGVTKPRIRILAASVLHQDTGLGVSSTFPGSGYEMVSNGVGLATRAGGPSSGSISISGIPSGATIRYARLIWVTIGGPDNTAVFQGTSRTGTLDGASHDCGSVNRRTPHRVYRASLPVSSVPGNGVYSVSGVGGTSGVDGQGASLIVVYSVPSSPMGRVHLRYGAMTTSWNMSHTFTGISLPSTPVSAHLNVGLGDGQSGSGSGDENPMLFAGSAVTPANFFTGSDGPRWDDLTISIPLSLLPVGVTSRTNSIQTQAVTDCLMWAYAALTYRY